jgi:hypothetical protein
MLHLPPAHHQTSRHDSPNETDIKVKLPKCLEFEFKSWQVNDSSQSNQGTNHLVSNFMKMKIMILANLNRCAKRGR